jgi:AraC-like DNA-binding protein
MLAHYPPAPALDPYIRRHYVFRGEMPTDADIQDTMIAETAFIRIPLRGDWYIEGEPGEWVSACGPKLFGANTKGLRLRFVGPFLILGCGIKPSGWKSLFNRSAHLYTDRMVSLEDVWGDIATDMMQQLRIDQSDEVMVAIMDEAITKQLDKIGLKHSDAQIERFETIGRIDSTVRIDDAANEIGLSVRQLERRSLESLGMTPKTFLRRCRFLDMAMTMRGFSHPSEEDLAALRYFDQSHLNREFKRFVGMTPKTFQNAYTPLMTAGLQLRKEGDEKIFNQPRF